MSPIRVLIAHSLNTYASSLAGLLQEIRPALAIERVEIDDLDDRIATVPGALVIADRTSDAIDERAAACILYYPDQRNVAIVRSGSAPRTIENPAWEDMLSAIDSAVAGMAGV
jgi:hypothetical protein